MRCDAADPTATQLSRCAQKNCGSDDLCMDHFTADQTKRMRKHWHSFRDKKLRTN